jgi:hypothetical protein
MGRCRLDSSGTGRDQWQAPVNNEPSNSIKAGGGGFASQEGLLHGVVCQSVSLFASQLMKERDHSEDLGIDERIILYYISGKCNGKLWTGLNWLRIGTPIVGSCEHGNEPSSSVKGGEFLNKLSDCWLLKKDSTPLSYIITWLWTLIWTCINRAQCLCIEMCSVTIAHPVICRLRYRHISVFRIGYGLADWGSWIRFLSGAGNFSLHHRVQHGSGAHPTSYPVGTGGSFPGGKAAGCEAEHSPPSSGEVTPPIRLHGVVLS